MMPTLPLATENLLIRPFAATDAHEFAVAARESVQTVNPWMSWRNPAFTENNALEWFATCDREREAGRAFDMGVFCRGSGHFLGGASINQLSTNHRYGNIGYWVRQSRQRQGIAKRAVLMLRDFGFEKLGLFRLEIVAALGNVASEAVAVSVGATRECIARNRVFQHGKPADAYVFSLTPNETVSPKTKSVV